MEIKTSSYKVVVGHLRVEIDFQAEAVYVRLDDKPSERQTEIVQGVVIADHDADGNIIGIEIIG